MSMYGKSDEAEMDFYNSRHFIINKNMLRFMGLWPYQKKLTKIVIRTIFTALCLTFIMPQVACVYVSRKNTDRVLEAIAVLFYLVAIALKYISYIVTEGKMQFLFENIVRNWKMLDTKAERNTLLKFSETGRLLTIGYMSYMFSALVIFITMPALPPVIDMISPLANGSRPKMYILDGEFLVDKLENYKNIYVFEACTCTLTVVIFSGIDSAYAVSVEQCLGLLAVVKARLKMATKYAEKSETDDCKADMAYEAVVKTAQLHKKVVDFAQVLESSYSTIFLVVMACNVGMLSVGSVVILIYLDRPMEVFRYALIYIGLSIHMFYLSWPGQKLIDSSTDIFHDAYNNEWYKCSIKCQNLLKFMMLRSIEPLELTCGGLYTMNFQNYGALTKSSFSYITIFASMR